MTGIMGIATIGIAEAMATLGGENTVVIETPGTEPRAQPSLPVAPVLFLASIQRQ